MKNNNICIYLSGSIKKGNRAHVTTFWDEHDLKKIETALLPAKTYFLNPALRSDNLSDSKSTFGRDMLQVFLSDLLLVDAREKRGVGVGAEMLFAKLLKTPVISLVPVDSHYRASHMQHLGQGVIDWIHPFIINLSSCIVPDLDTIPNKIKDYISLGVKRNNISEVFTSGYGFIFDAMKHYLENQCKQDKEMFDIINVDGCLKEKIRFFFGTIHNVLL